MVVLLDKLIFTLKSLQNLLEQKIIAVSSLLEQKIIAVSSLIVNPDWNQNDPSTNDYIKNRPFYTSDTKIECYREQEITFDEEGIAGSLSSSDSDSYLSDGDTITVIVDGVSYSGKAYNSGPPIYEIWWNAPPFEFDYDGVRCSDSSFYGRTVKIQLFKVKTSIVKMGKQFLPSLSVNDLDDFPETVGQKTDDRGEIFNAAKSAGWNAHAEGLGTIASGDRSHAEGWETIASGKESHAEGSQTTASGKESHAEGSRTTASGDYSHSEGGGTTASGMGSHAEGYETIASGYYSHVQGQFNVEDTENKYVHIVGNGSSNDKRSNAHTLDWEGNAWFAGSVECTSIILKSSTAGSTKKFMLTVDDNGAISVK